MPTGMLARTTTSNTRYDQSPCRCRSPDLDTANVASPSAATSNALPIVTTTGLESTVPAMIVMQATFHEAPSTATNETGGAFGARAA